MYGLSEKTIKAIQGILEKYPQIDKVILYGSRAKGTFRNGSDIDLVLVGDKLTLSDQFRIETELDDLLLPYMIDLALYQQIENEDLVGHIDRMGMVFFENVTVKGA